MTNTTDSPKPAGSPPAPSSASGTLLPFDPLRVLLAVARLRWVLLAATLAGAAGAAFLGARRFQTHATAQVQLVRREVQNNFQASETGESFRPRQFNAATIAAMLRATSLMERTGASLTPPLAAAELQRRLTIRPERNTDLITVVYDSSDSPARAAETVNAFAANAVELTREMQSEEARELLGFLSFQHERAESELTAARAELAAHAKASGSFDAGREAESHLRQLGELDLKVETARIELETIGYRVAQIERELAKQDPAMQRLQEARDKLGELLAEFTPQHPSVVEQQARVAALEERARAPAGDATDRFQSTGNTVANSLYLDLIGLRGQRESLTRQQESLRALRESVRRKLDGLPEQALEQARLRSRIDSLAETRDLVGGRRREAQLFAEKAPGYYRVFATCVPDAVRVSNRSTRIAAAGVLGGLAAAGLLALVAGVRAARDDTVVSPSDLRRLTRARVLARLPDGGPGDEAAAGRWRFTTWAALVRAVPAPPDGAWVAGLLSAGPGEGRSTWIAHLAQAASERGLRVLTLSHGGSPARPSLAQAIEHPAEVTARLAPGTIIALTAEDGWIWTPERLRRWRDALATWRAQPELVILVELPDATRLDALLLAETLPAVLWLSASGVRRARDAAACVRALAGGGVPLAGSLLNRAPAAFDRLPDLSRFGLCLALALALGAPRGPARAQEESGPGPAPAAHGPLPPVSTPAPPAPAAPAEEPAETPLVRPEAAPRAVDPEPADGLPENHPPLADWQQRLTLGPGDLVNLQVHGRRETVRTEVPVGPDGTLTYLHVHGFRAEGLTIDELRDGLSAALRDSIQNARVIVTPAAFRSKRYFLLGTVIDRGAYTLDRPVTLLEAIARARGIATGLREQNTVEIADLRRAFLVRGGQKLDVDFHRLLAEGDTTRNVALEPGDYIYLPSSVVNEAHVLGAVRTPGQVGVEGDLTALGAITVRGGFTPGAWRKRVLVVRGGLDGEARRVITVDAAAVLAGRAADEALQPRDIVYVAERPWREAELVADLAVRAFLQAGIATWTGRNVGEVLEEPLLPTLRSP